MSKHPFQHSGACDCGAVRFDYHCHTALSELHPRACQCDYCRPGGLCYVSEPASRLQVRARDLRYLYAQSFATGTAEFMHCAICNHPVYVRSEIGGRYFALVVAQAMQDWPLPLLAEPVDYAGESVSQRLQRRASHWIGELQERADEG